MALAPLMAGGRKKEEKLMLRVPKSELAFV